MADVDCAFADFIQCCIVPFSLSKGWTLGHEVGLWIARETEVR